MAVSRVEERRAVDPARSRLARKLAHAEVWRRTGWWVAVCATAWAIAACGACIAAVGAGCGLRVSLAAATELFFGAAVAASLAALCIFAVPWRKAPAAAGAQKLLLSPDDELLTAAEALDGRAFVSAGLARLLYARALARLSGLRLPRMALFAPWRVARMTILTAAVLLGLSLAMPGAWEHRIAEVGLPVQPAPATRLAPVPAPALTSFSLHVEPPAYTSRAAFELLRPASFQAPAGSKLRLRASFADCQQAAAVVGAVRSAGAADIDAEAVLSTTVSWELSAVGPGGKTKLGPFTAVAIPDARPKVLIEKPARDMDLPLADEVGVAVTASDDYNLSRVVLQWRIEGRGGWQEIELAAGAGQQWRGGLQLDLRPMRLLAGDSVLLRAAATDNRASVPQTTVTSVRRLTIAHRARQATEKPATFADQAAGREEEAWQRLRGGLGELDAALEELQDLAAGQASSVTGQHQAAFADLAHRLDKAREDIKAAMADLERRLQLHDLVDETMLDKIAELHRLADEVLDRDLKDLLERLAEAARAADLGKLAQDAEKLCEMRDKFMRQLDQTLNLLKRARLEMLLDALRRKLDDLADRQEQTLGRTEKMREADAAARREAQKQSQLARETEGLPDETRLAAERARDLDPDAAARLDDLADSVRRSDPAADMRQAASALSRVAPQAATGPQRAALQKLRRAAGEVAGLQADTMGRQRQELQAEAGRAVAEAMSLAGAQAGLSRETEPLGRRATAQALAQKSRLERLAARQRALADGAYKTAQRLQRLSGRTPAASPELAARMEAIAEAMRQAARSIQGGEGGEANALQQAALASLNRLASDLAALQQALGKQSATEALSEYLHSLEQLAQQQQALNQQAQAAGDGSPLLSELAAQQAMLRAALDKLLQSSGQQLSDRLGGVGEDMNEVAKDLSQRRLTAQTKQRQDDILHKMLDAQRSLYTRQQESRERVAERPKPWTPPPSPPAVKAAEPPKLRLPPTEERPVIRVPSDYQALAAAYERRIGARR